MKTPWVGANWRSDASAEAEVTRWDPRGTRLCGKVRGHKVMRMMDLDRREDPWLGGRPGATET